MSGTLGLYLHVPFCRSKCAYCDFYSLPRREDAMAAYVDAMARQMDDWRDRAADYAVDTVYLGGGTPSLLGPALLTRLLDAVFRRFRVTPGAEITLECNPDSAGAALLAAARAAGVNRLSLGVQSAAEETLRRLGRPHTFRQAEEAAARARTAGFDNLSLDLMYGLPGETDAALADSLERCLALAPEHLSLYGLKPEPGTPLGRGVQAGTLCLPDGDTQAERYLRCCRRLEQAGLSQYEISNFARAGRESRHNLRYWLLQPYLGFGPGAHSDFGGRRFAWARDLDAFLSGAPARSEDQAVSPREREEERIMLGLRTRAGIPAALAPAALRARLCRAGYAVEAENRLRLTPAGYFVSNSIILEIMGA